MDRFASAWKREFPHADLTPREAEYVYGMALGETYAQTSKRHRVSLQTVKQAVYRASEKAWVDVGLLRTRLLYAMGREAGIDEASTIGGPS